MTISTLVINYSNLSITRLIHGGNMRVAQVTRVNDYLFTCRYAISGLSFTCDDMNFEVFTGTNAFWETSSEGKVPRNAIPIAGCDLCIGRLSFARPADFGLVDRNHRHFFYPALVNGQWTEANSKTYQVLCQY